jgi:uncharacterized protein (TIGR03067 family)
MVAALGLALAGLGQGLWADEKDTEPTGDLKQMQGEWISKEDQGESVWTFKGNRLTLKTSVGRNYEIELKVDEKAEPIKAIDLKGMADSPNGANYDAPGIYKFEDDKLFICFGSPQAGRPTEFKMDFAAGTFLFEMTRKK